VGPPRTHPRDRVRRVRRRLDDHPLTRQTGRPREHPPAGAPHMATENLDGFLFEDDGTVVDTEADDEDATQDSDQN